MRFRLYPTPEQEAVLRSHCSSARLVWNIGNEQRLMYRPGRGSTPGYAEQSRQLTEARQALDWLAAVPRVVQEQALRDLDLAWRGFFSGRTRRPGWRKAGAHEGFRVHHSRHGASVRKINRRWASVHVPGIGHVRFRRTRDVPAAKSYRIALDRAGRWHVAFPIVPIVLAAPATGEVVGIDRGVVVTLALSDGRTYQAPAPKTTRRAARAVDRCRKGSNRRATAKARVARQRARTADARKDWAHKASTEIARSCDLIRVEDLRVSQMVRRGRGKRGLNRSIHQQGWSLFLELLDYKAAGRVERVPAAYTSQRCSACGHTCRENRKSQAAFLCVSCGYASNADLNAAINIAAGNAATARGGMVHQGQPVKREPALPLAG